MIPERLKRKLKDNQNVILCLNNIPLLCLAEPDNDEVFRERDQEVISPTTPNDNMDSRIGLDYIVENSDYVSKLAAALDTNNEIVKKQVFELLSALCAYSRSGYCRAIETLENYKVNISTSLRVPTHTIFTFMFFSFSFKESQSRTIPLQSGRHGARQNNIARIQSGALGVHQLRNNFSENPARPTPCAQ